MGACPGVCYLLLDDLLNQSFWNDVLETWRGSEDRKVAGKDKVGRLRSGSAERVLQRIIVLACLCSIDRVSHIAVELAGHVKILSLHIVLLKVCLGVSSPEETLQEHRIMTAKVRICLINRVSLMACLILRLIKLVMQ